MTVLESLIVASKAISEPETSVSFRVISKSTFVSVIKDPPTFCMASVKVIVMLLSRATPVLLSSGLNVASGGRFNETAAPFSQLKKGYPLFKTPLILSISQ